MDLRSNTVFLHESKLHECLHKRYLPLAQAKVLHQAKHCHMAIYDSGKKIV
jgi:hypothetical protein